MLAVVVSAIIALSQPRGSTAPGISENTIRAHIKFLSDDMLEGRGTGARGGEIAAKYIAAQMEALGLKGAGSNGSFLQPVALVGVKADPGTRLKNLGQQW